LFHLWTVDAQTPAQKLFVIRCASFSMLRLPPELIAAHIEKQLPWIIVDTRHAFVWCLSPLRLQHHRLSRHVCMYVCIPDCSLDGSVDDIKMARHSHWRCRVATQRCAPNPMPKLSKGL
jgi:hypothetical protein